MDSMDCRLGNVGDGMGVGVKDEEKINSNILYEKNNNFESFLL